ncbi:MAG TPA: tetratricopeptide repeat protein [Rhodanobacteraceae bacterium]|nr:tetratricopeptide repeat protein [Rhodanobacteraceae bacterium]
MAEKKRTATVAGDALQSEKQCRARLFTHPDDTAALEVLGRLCAQSGRVAEGRSYLERALGITPQSPDLQQSAARLAMLAGDIEAAEEGFRRALELRPNFAAAAVGLGQVAQARQQWINAERHFREAARNAPDDVEVLLGLGQVRLARGDGEEAARWFMRATQLYPQHPVALTHYAGALLSHGSAQAAARPLNRALEIEPGHLPARVLLGRVELARGRPEAARVAFAAVLEQEPGEFEAQAGLGHALRALGRTAEAVAAYDAALALRPDAEELVTARSVCLLQEGQAETAVGDLRAWIAAHPRSSGPRMLLADIYDQAGRSGDAVTLWQQAANADRSDAVAHAELARRREFEGNFGAAHSAAEACAEDKRPSTLLLRARIALRGDAAARAQRELLAIDAAKLPPELALERFRLLGVVHDHNGRYAEAVLAFREAQRMSARPLPVLADADAAAPRLRSLRALEVLEAPRSPAPVLLLGLPGTRVEDVAVLLADQPGVAVRTDRFKEQLDLFGDADDPALLEALSQQEVHSLARRYRRALSRAVPAAATRVVDWLPVLDVRVLAQARRALPGLRAIRIDGDPRRAFLRWLAFGWDHLHAVEPVAAARWWRRARAHLDVAEDIIPVERLDGEALLADPARAGADAARLLGLGSLCEGHGASEQRQRKYMLAMQFALSDPGAYEAVLGEALAALD